MASSDSGEGKHRRKKQDGEDSVDKDAHRKKRKERREEKEREKEKRRSRKRKQKRDSPSESSSGSDSEVERKKRKLLKKAKKLLKEKEKSSTQRISSIPPAEQITADDYFKKNPEFSTWLKEEKGAFFSSLTSEESHEKFLKFVKVWNSGGLDEKYYSGLGALAAPRTAHNWAIKGTAGRQQQQQQLEAADLADWEMVRNQQRAAERKRFRKDQSVVLEELAPKATGREAAQEQRALRRQNAKEREASPEMMGERDLLGGGDDFQSRLARERAWRERKATAKQTVAAEKQSQYMQKEEATLGQFRDLIRMAGGKLSIPKRT